MNVKFSINRNRIFMVHFILILSSLMALQARGEREENDYLTLFNAASTTDLVDDLIKMYTSKTGSVIHSNPGASGTLAKQLYEGAKGDILISASPKWVDFLKERNLVSESKILFWNSLVLIAPGDSDFPMVRINSDFDLPASFKGRLSMGDPAHVPAGEYGRQALEYYNWESLLSDRILPAANVRAALSVVEMGETELGIVYATDALKSDRVRVVGVFPASSHKPIGYYSALMTEASPGAVEFYRFLSSPEAGKLYLQYGFLLTTAGTGDE